jgi:DNA-binding transcriptional LysR family regulator
MDAGKAGQAMDAWDLQVFGAVAREGGMTKAARSLHTVQSNVTKRIRLLEEELDTILFHRQKKGVSLTTAGEQLLPYAEKVHRLLSEAKGTLMKTLAPRGPLRIGAIETSVAMRLSPLFTRYGKTYPDVELSIETDTTGSLVTDVLEYRLEGAFVAGPIKHPQLVSVPVCEEELVLYGPARFGEPARYVKSKKPKVLVFRAGCSYREMVQRIFSRWGVDDVKFLEFSSLDGILSCVAAGLGVTLFPKGISDGPQWKSRWGKEISAHRLPKSDAAVPTVFIRRADAFVSPAMLRLIELIPSVNGKARR